MNISPTLSRFLNNRSIASKIFLMVIPVLLIAIGAGCFVLWNSYRQYRRASTLQQANTVSDFILRAAAEQAKERGFTATVLANSSDETTRSKIQPLRTKGDSYLDSAIGAAQSIITENGIGAEEARAVAKARVDRDAFRTKLDDVLGKSAVAGNTIKEWIGFQTALILAEKNFANALFVSSHRLEMILAFNSRIKNSVLNASEFAGRERANLGTVIGTKKPISPETYAALMRYRGIVEESIAVILAFAESPQAPSSVKEAAGVMQKILREEYEPARSAIYTASASALASGQEFATYELTTSEWIERSTKGINAMLMLSETVSKEVQIIAAEEYNSSTGLMIVSSVTVLLLLFVAVFAFIVQRSITARLIALQNNAKEIEQGRFNVNIDQAGTDEIAQVTGSFAIVVDTLRQFASTQQSLMSAALEGNMRARADSVGYAGGFQEMVQATNDVLDAAVKPVQEALTSLQAMANGDFTRHITSNFQGDHALLKEAINQTLDSMNSTMTDVLQTANFVLQSSRQVALASQSLSSGSVEQAASLQEITSSVHEIASQITHTASSAGVATDLAQKSQAEAMEGNEDMLYLNETVQAINDSSGSIAGIVKTIDDIAFQTNMLALNAAIEAARAGRHGKGFAVVAEEVRSLARRSAEAARKTTSLIENAVANAVGSFSQTQITTERFQTIVHHATETAALVREINEHTSQQASGINQITVGLSQIDKVVQITAANAEESAAAAQELESHAQNLHQLLARFVLLQKREQSALEVAWSD